MPDLLPTGPVASRLGVSGPLSFAPRVSCPGSPAGALGPGGPRPAAQAHPTFTPLRIRAWPRDGPRDTGQGLRSCRSGWHARRSERRSIPRHGECRPHGPAPRHRRSLCADRPPSGSCPCGAAPPHFVSLGPRIGGPGSPGPFLSSHARSRARPAPVSAGCSASRRLARRLLCASSAPSRQSSVIRGMPKALRLSRGCRARPAPRDRRRAGGTHSRSRRHRARRPGRERRGAARGRSGPPGRTSRQGCGIDPEARRSAPVSSQPSTR